MSGRLASRAGGWQISFEGESTVKVAKGTREEDPERVRIFDKRSRHPGRDFSRGDHGVPWMALRRAWARDSSESAVWLNRMLLAFLASATISGTRCGVRPNVERGGMW